jgi:hypothetical protein
MGVSVYLCVLLSVALGVIVLSRVGRRELQMCMHATQPDMHTHTPVLTLTHMHTHSARDLTDVPIAHQAALCEPQHVRIPRWPTARSRQHRAAQGHNAVRAAT